MCVQQLLWITAPEATCRLIAANNGEVLKQMQQNYHIDISSIYFKNQLYSSLPAFVDHVTNDPTWKIDEFRTSLIAMTYSPLVQNAAQFPFSLFFFRIFETMRGLAESAGEVALIQQFALLNLDSRISGVCSEEIIHSYVHDIVCMTFPPIHTMDSKVQSEVVEKLLCLVPVEQNENISMSNVFNQKKLNVEHNTKNDDDDDDDETKNYIHTISNVQDSKADIEPQENLKKIFSFNDLKLHYLASVHARLWKIERKLNLIFSLLDMIPHSHNTFLSFVRNDIHSVDDNTFMNILELVLQSLLITNQKWENINDCTIWVSAILVAKSTILSLFDILQSTKNWNRSKVLWEKLDFFLTFVRDITLPLELEPSYIVQILSPFEIFHY